MSVEDLKARLRDVPGIEHLTMQNLVGRKVLGWNGLIAGLDPSATDEQIEQAIRTTAGMATSSASPVSVVSPSPGAALSSLPSGESELPATVASALGEATIPTPLPTVNITEAKPMTAPTSPTGFVPGEISSLFKTLRARKDAMVADIMNNGAEVAATLEAGEKMSAQLKAEGDAMKAEFGLLTNNPPA